MARKTKKWLLHNRALNFLNNLESYIDFRITFGRRFTETPLGELNPTETPIQQANSTAMKKARVDLEAALLELLEPDEGA
jgi:hypothetical protein